MFEENRLFGKFKHYLRIFLIKSYKKTDFDSTTLHYYTKYLRPTYDFFEYFSIFIFGFLQSIHQYWVLKKT